MAIAFDAVTSSDATSFSHTCSGSDRILFVGVKSVGQTTGVTYNSVSMTSIAEIQVGATGEYVNIYYLIAPASGSNTVAVSGGSDYTSRAVSYTGAAQTGQPDAFGSNNASSSATISQAITVVASGCWGIAFMRNNVSFSDDNSGDIPTKRGTDASIAFFDSNGTVSTGTVTGAYTTRSSGSAAWGLVVASFSPAASTFRPHMISF